MLALVFLPLSHWRDLLRCLRTEQSKNFSGMLISSLPGQKVHEGRTRLGVGQAGAEAKGGLCRYLEAGLPTPAPGVPGGSQIQSFDP